MRTVLYVSGLVLAVLGCMSEGSRSDLDGSAGVAGSSSSGAKSAGGVGAAGADACMGGPIRGSLSARGILPAVAVSGCQVHVAWLGADAIGYLRSLNGGASWMPEAALATGDGIVNYGVRPSLVASGEHVYLVWAETLDGDLRVRFRASQDGGQSWGPSQTLGTGRSGALGVGAARGGVRGLDG